MKKRILSVICVSLTAALTLTACGSSTTSSSSSQESNSELSNDELKELTMEGGISPYDFKEEVKEKLGKKCYEENIFSDFGEIFNAELDQVGTFWDSKDEAVNHNAGDSSGTEGIHLLTYKHEINTGAENPAYLDVVTFITDILGPYEITLYTNDDYSYFYLEEPLTAYGSFNIAFRIIDNSMVYAVICEGKEDPYDFLCRWDSTGEYGMRQINTDNLVDITDTYKELYTESESETKDSNDTDVAKTEESTGSQLDGAASWPDTSGAKTSIDKPVPIETAAATIEGPYVLEKGHSGDKYICYFVTNTSDMNISFSLSVDCYDKDDNLLNSLMPATSDQREQCLEPGEAALEYKGFYYKDEIASVKPEIMIYESDYTSATEYMDIERVEDNGEENYFRYECKNTSSSTIYSPEITVVYYTDDELLGFDNEPFFEIGTNNTNISSNSTGYSYTDFPDGSSFNIRYYKSGYFKD